MKFAAWNPFRIRNFVAIALILGLIIGAWLGDLFKGFGLGPGKGAGLGPGDGSSDSPSQATTRLTGASNDTDADIVGHHADDTPVDGDAPKPRGLLKVLIDDRDYYVRRGDKTEPIALAELVDLIRRTPPDADGMRARIDRTADSRPSAEDKLFTALKDAGVSKDAVYMPTQPVD